MRQQNTIILIFLILLMIPIISATPSITNCVTNSTSLNCDGTAKLTCNVTDALNISSTKYEINGLNYSATLNNSLFQVQFTPFEVGETKTYNWKNSYSNNTINEQNTTLTNLNISYSCSNINPFVTNTTPNSLTFSQNSNIPIQAFIYDFNIPNTVKYTIKLPNATNRTQTATNGLVTRVYDSKKNETELVNIFNNFLTIVGDLTTSYFVSTDWLIRTPPTATINMITMTAHDSLGSPLIHNFQVNISICPTTVSNLTANGTLGADCSSPPTIVATNQLYATNQTRNDITYIPINPFVMSSSNKYILTFILTNFTPDGISDGYRVMASPTQSQNHRRTFNTSVSQTFGFLSDMNLFTISPYSVNFTETTAGGIYNISYFANDTFNNINQTQTSFFTISCAENWSQSLGTCQTNDTQRKTYTDLNSCGTNTTLPIDNGTNTPCNYCTQNITTTYGTCDYTGFQTINYTDQNYASCCFITGIVSDCSILYSPYNETGSQSCNYFTQNFNCTLDTTPIINKKINLVCELPTNEEYSCVVNVYQETTNSSILLATNPEYKKSSGSLLSLAQESEERTSFKTSGKLLNAYYTNKELRPDDTFKIETKCYTNTTSLTSQYVVTPTYDTPDWTINRLVWFKNNTTFSLLSLLAIFLILLAFAFAINKLRGR